MEEESWRGNHSGCIMVESSLKRQPGKGSQEKAPGDTKEAPGSTQEAPRRHQRAPRRQPGGTQICICVCVCIWTKSVTFTGFF